MRTISFILDVFILESRMVLSTRSMGERKRSAFNSSKQDRVMVEWKSIPSEENSMSIKASVEEDSTSLARSQAVRS